MNESNRVELYKRVMNAKSRVAETFRVLRRVYNSWLILISIKITLQIYKALILLEA